MNIGARIGCWSGGGLSAKDYVQDGLIAMWDGIENAGWGTHDANATTWKDLIGIYTASQYVRGSLSFGANYGYFNGSTCIITNSYFGSPKYLSIESCFDVSLQSTSRIISATASGGWALERENGGNFYIVGYNGVYKFARSTVPAQSGLHQLSGTIGDDGLRLYRLGNIDSYTSFIGGTSVGQYGTIGGRGGGAAYKGKIHCLRLYNRALTADEIAANYAVDKARFGLT